MAFIREALGDLVKSPMTANRTIDQMRADDAGSATGDKEDEIPPEIARQAVDELLDRHYRQTLDQPVPAVEAGRRKIVEWLKLLENRSASNAGSPLAEYDFRLMWEEMRLEGQRR